MEKTRFYIGMENLKKIDRKGSGTVIQSLETVSPGLGKYIVDFQIVHFLLLGFR